MNLKTITASALSVLTLAAVLAGPASAQNGRQKDKNNMRNLGIGAGAAAAYEAIHGKGTNALILGAGAAMAGKKYEDARKAQAKENKTTRRYVYKNGRRVGYYKIRNGERQGYVSLRG